MRKDSLVPSGVAKNHSQHVTISESISTFMAKYFVPSRAAQAFFIRRTFSIATSDIMAEIDRVVPSRVAENGQQRVISQGTSKFIRQRKKYLVPSRVAKYY